MSNRGIDDKNLIAGEDCVFNSPLAAVGRHLCLACAVCSLPVWVFWGNLTWFQLLGASDLPMLGGHRLYLLASLWTIFICLEDGRSSKLRLAICIVVSRMLQQSLEFDATSDPATDAVLLLPRVLTALSLPLLTALCLIDVAFSCLMRASFVDAKQAAKRK